MDELAVRVLNEGTDVWAKVPAQHVEMNIYVILENTVEVDAACELEFHSGDLVTTMEQTGSDGSVFLAAQRLYVI